MCVMFLLLSGPGNELTSTTDYLYGRLVLGHEQRTVAHKEKSEKPPVKKDDVVTL